MITTSLPKEEVICDFYQKLGWNDFLKLDSNTLVCAMLKSNYSVYAYAGETLVGTGRVISDDVINAYICGIGVLNEFRHRGIATRIIEQLVQHCLESNLHIQLFCEKDLVGFYEQKGFKKFAVGMIWEDLKAIKDV